VLKEFAEIISLDQFFDVQYHSCMNNFEPAVWENISEIQRKYGDLTGKMMGDLILASAFYNSLSTHVTKVRQILERDPEYDANRGDFTNQLEKMTQISRRGRRPMKYICKDHKHCLRSPACQGQRQSSKRKRRRVRLRNTAV
jgi:hypothetical protein